MPRQGSRASNLGRFGAGVVSEPDWDVLNALTERAFQAQVIQYARVFGWAVYHTHDSRRSQPGFPDLVLVRRPRIVWVELKSQRGKVTPEQQAWLDELRACDQEVHVWRPSDWRIVEGTLR